MRLTPVVLDPEPGDELLGAVVAPADELPLPVPALVVAFELEPHAAVARAISTAATAIPATRGNMVSLFEAPAAAGFAAVVWEEGMWSMGSPFRRPVLTL
jgi:hypothetical protein